VLLRNVVPDGFPEIIAPKGLTEQRKKYLYENIREFVDARFQVWHS
jgi:hypothetical protein